MTVMHIDDDAVLTRSDGSTAKLEDDTIVVRDPDGRDILSVSANGVCLTAVEGDLRLAAPHGRVIIESAHDLDITVAGAVALRARQVVQSVGRWELVAERVVQRASDLYQQVDGLLHTQAGRVRRVVEGTHQLIAKRASIACDDDVSIDGHRVLLG